MMNWSDKTSAIAERVSRSIDVLGAERAAAELLSVAAPHGKMAPYAVPAETPTVRADVAV